MCSLPIGNKMKSVASTHGKHAGSNTGRMPGQHGDHVRHMKPEGAQGRAQVARLGRTYKTGGFEKIEQSAAKRYGSKAAGERVAGAIFNKMAQAHKAMHGK